MVFTSVWAEVVLGDLITIGFRQTEVLSDMDCPLALDGRARTDGFRYPRDWGESHPAIRDAKTQGRPVLLSRLVWW